MADVLANEGAIDALTDLVNGETWKWVLFSNNITPALTTVWANLTECTFPGYARINSAYASPAIAGAVDGAQSLHAQITFTCTGGGSAQNVYGYALIDTVGPKIIFAAQIPSAPKVMLNNGDAVLLTPNLTLRQG
jgi:hypothetical protein